MKTQILFLMALLCAVVASVHSTQANTITVTNTNQSGPGSLRRALAVAKDGDTIDATGVSGRILLTSGFALQIITNVSIKGPGAGNLAIESNVRVFENFAVATISGFTITNAAAGGIRNAGGLILRNSSVVANAGGGIENAGGFAGSSTATLTITNCTVSGNSGGGIINAAGAILGAGDSQALVTVSNCTISGNSASNGGGIVNSTFGGGLHIARVTIGNSTLSDNSATGDGGAIYNSRGSFNGRPLAGDASVSVSNCTISGNSATGAGGGIYNDGAAELELGDTILNRGSSGGNIVNHGGKVTSLGYNLASDHGGGFLTGPGDQINTNPMLGPLQHNGGPTFTHALLPGSPAIDAGDPNFIPPPFFDQRGPGHHRVVNGRIDIGSFEVQVPTPTAP